MLFKTLAVHQPPANPDGTVELLRHLAFERIAPQWRDFLVALGSSLQAQLSSDDLRQLLKSIGQSVAAAHPLPETPDVSALEDAMNRFWFDRGWGVVSVSEQAGVLLIEHRACPLPAAMQIDAEVAGGYLEGIYGAWLAAAGAPAELSLAQLPPPDAPMTMAFELRAR